MSEPTPNPSGPTLWHCTICGRISTGDCEHNGVTSRDGLTETESAAHAAGHAAALQEVNEAAEKVRMFRALFDWDDDGSWGGWVLSSYHRPQIAKQWQAEGTTLTEAILAAAEGGEDG
jgi:hypothetical protein